MKIMEISEKEFVASKACARQLSSQIKNLKSGLLNVLDAVDSLAMRCIELSIEKEKQAEEVN